MAGKAKHRFHIRENPDYTWSILTRTADGKEVWYGSYSMAQSAVRWGMSHRNQEKFPCAVMKAEDDLEYLFQDSPATSRVSADPVQRGTLALLISMGVDPSNPADVADALGVEESSLESVIDPSNGQLIYQLKSGAENAQREEIRRADNQDNAAID